MGRCGSRDEEKLKFGKQVILVLMVLSVLVVLFIPPLPVKKHYRPRTPEVEWNWLEGELDVLPTFISEQRDLSDRLYFTYSINALTWNASEFASAEVSWDLTDYVGGACRPDYIFSEFRWWLGHNRNFTLDQMDITWIARDAALKHPLFECVVTLGEKTVGDFLTNVSAIHLAWSFWGSIWYEYAPNPAVIYVLVVWAVMLFLHVLSHLKYISRPKSTGRDYYGLDEGNAS